MPKPSVLFVCLGNICRSPLAEAAFREEAKRIGLDIEIDSAGTGGWHAGEPPDHRAIATARKHGIDISSYRARKVTVGDFRRFTHIIGLDFENLADLQRLHPHDGTADLSLLLDHVPERAGEAVSDPWYGDMSDFDVTWNDVTAGAKALAAELALL